MITKIYFLWSTKKPDTTEKLQSASPLTTETNIRLFLGSGELMIFYHW